MPSAAGAFSTRSSGSLPGSTRFSGSWRSPSDASRSPLSFERSSTSSRRVWASGSSESATSIWSSAASAVPIALIGSPARRCANAVS